MNELERFEALDQAMLVRVDVEREILIAWNGSATFNVFSLPNLEPVDCFTRYYGKGGYGPRDGTPEPTFSKGMAWASKCIADILRIDENEDAEAMSA